MTQTEQVVAALRRHGEQGLTPLEALHDLRIMRLASRIVDAKQVIRDDEEIVTERVRLNGKTFARYVLRRRTAPEGEQGRFKW
jgi:hypothetical protein